MRNVARLALFAAIALGATGCRFKGYEAFSSATTPRPDLFQYPKRGDAFSYGGTADASGGLEPQAQYGAGAKNAGTVLPGYDQPQKGSGQQDGEYPNVASAGHAQSNAPAFQPSPSDVGR